MSDYRNLEKVKFKSKLPIEFEIKTNIQEMYSRAGHLFTKRHRPTFYHIIWVTKGNIVHEVDLNPISIKADSILFVKKDCIHKFSAMGDYEGRVLLFTENFFCKNDDDRRFFAHSILYNDLYETTPFIISPSDLRFEELFALMLKEYNEPTEVYHQDILRNYLHNFLLMADQDKRKQDDFKKVEPGPELKRLVAFKNSLEKNYKTNKSVQYYATDLGVTVKQLNKTTLHILEKSAKQMIDERILLEAKRMLLHDTLTIKEIGFDLGFDEPTNFIKYFKKHHHVTPVEFKKNHLKRD